MMCYNYAKGSMKESVQTAGKNMRTSMHKAGKEFSSDINSIKDQASLDMANGTVDFNSYAERGQDAAGNVVAKGEQAVSGEVDNLSKDHKKFQNLITLSIVIRYLAFLIGLVACVYGPVQVYKLKNSSEMKIPGTRLMNLTFIIFFISTLLSLSSPLGISCRIPIGLDADLVELTRLITAVCVLLFVAGWVLWFFGTRKLYKTLPQYKSAYTGAMLIATFVTSNLLPPVLLLGAFYLVIKGWMTANKEVPAAETVPAQPITPAQPETVPVAAPAPVSVPAQQPVEKPVASATTAKGSRTLTIVFAAAAVIIIGLLCVILLRNGDSRQPEEIQSLDADTVTATASPAEEEIATVPQTSHYPGSGDYELKGTIAGKSVEVWIQSNPYGDVNGAYNYIANKSADAIHLSGTFDSDGNLIIDEYYYDEQTGVWNVTFTSRNTLQGSIMNAKGHSYPINLVVTSFNSFE
ncbi:MAG: hypothetical protein K2L39_08180 [Muribaculaceae bacterium]|nr:hypothetical protein [Muribaculaceae bacterium]